jgi:hypothetical protein
VSHPLAATAAADMQHKQNPRRERMG